MCAWDKAKSSGSDLISDIDANDLANNTALEALLSDLHGWVNLKVVRTNVTTVTVTADQLFLQGTATLATRVTSVSEAIAITTSGASGLDTGAEANGWYYIWIIAKDDGTVNGLLSSSSTSPTMPADYTRKALVSAVHNTSGDFVDFTQTGRKYCYASWIVLATGAFGTYRSAWGSLDVTETVPSSLSTFAFGSMHASVSGVTFITNDSGISVTAGTDSRNKFGTTGINTSVPWAFDILTANTLYGQGYDAGCTIYVAGFEINKI